MIADVVAVLVLLAAMFICIISHKLTVAGGVTGLLVGLLIYMSAGYPGLFLLATFFLLATLATSHKCDLKKQVDPGEEQTQGRTAGQVLANGGVAALVGAAGLLVPGFAPLVPVLMAAALSAATADTLSSELGMVYGKRFYNILTFKKDVRGLNGVISLEGFIAGLLGSTCIAVVLALATGFNTRMFVIVLLAGTAGNLVDSLLGATLERKQVLNNDAVNSLNTLAACLLALLLL